MWGKKRSNSSKFSYTKPKRNTSCVFLGDVFLRLFLWVRPWETCLLAFRLLSKTAFSSCIFHQNENSSRFFLDRSVFERPSVMTISNQHGRLSISFLGCALETFLWVYACHEFLTPVNVPCLVKHSSGSKFWMKADVAPSPLCACLTWATSIEKFTPLAWGFLSAIVQII